MIARALTHMEMLRERKKPLYDMNQSHILNGGRVKKIIDASCPSCDETIYVPIEDAYLENQIYCPECGALLKVVNESPLELEEIF